MSATLRTPYRTGEDRCSPQYLFDHNRLMVDWWSGRVPGMTDINDPARAEQARQRMERAAKRLREDAA